MRNDTYRLERISVVGHQLLDVVAERRTRMKGTPLYLRYLGLLCALMAVFCLGVFVIGYKEPSFGRVATLALLLVAAPSLLYASHRLGKRR